MVVLLCVKVVISQRTEAFFNTTAVTVLRTTLNVQGHTSLSFRTCKGGELLYQRGDSGDSIRFEVMENGTLVLEWQTDNRKGAFVHPSGNLNNNQWHVLDFRKSRPLVVTLAVDAVAVVVSNATYNTDLQKLDLTSRQNVQLVVGSAFSGCIQQGIGVQLSKPGIIIIEYDVVWDECPLEQRVRCSELLF